MTPSQHPTFVRIAHRQGWVVEVVRAGGVVESDTLASREEALSYAEALAPDWIEIGDIVGLGTPAQQHSWSTRRRSPDGTYLPSALRWRGKG